MSIYTSLLTAGANSHQETSENVNALATDFVSQGIVGTIGSSGGVAPLTGAYAVNAQGTPNMTVSVGTGIAYVTATPTSQGSQSLRVRSTTTATVGVSANSSGSTKYDFLYLQIDATKAANPALDASDVASLIISRSSSNSTDNGTPPTYGLLLAVITVSNGAASIVNGNISDRRILTSVGSSVTSTSAGWNPLGQTVTYNANNGQKEFVLATASDLTGVLSVGQKLRLDRTISPPTQSMAFTAASSQYATKASPSGITFTGAFTCEAWVYLNSYTANDMAVLSRYDGTNGWIINTQAATGQLVCQYFSTGQTKFMTYQSLPLKRWVHIAVSVSSTSTKTAAIYINGASVPFTTPSSVATTITQAGSLQVGAYNSSATSVFDGYLSEARVWSVAQSQTNIQSNMAISLSGSESNLVALFQGNGNFNDKTSNANNLTATNGAIATQTANPYNSTEYGIITKVTSSQLTIFTGTDSTVPNMALSNVQYSTARAPQGFPVGREKWLVDATYLTNMDLAATGLTKYWLNAQLSIPTGEWFGSYQGPIRCTLSSGTVNALTDFNSNASGSPNYSSTSVFKGQIYHVIGGATSTDTMDFLNVRAAISVTAQTVYNLFGYSTPTLTNFGIRGDFSPFVLAAESAYI